jgi:hypothetical protein
MHAAADEEQLDINQREEKIFENYIKAVETLENLRRAGDCFEGEL